MSARALRADILKCPRGTCSNVSAKRFARTFGNVRAGGSRGQFKMSARALRANIFKCPREALRADIFRADFPGTPPT